MKKSPESKRQRRKKRISVVRSDAGEKVELGNGSYSNLILTNNTVRDSKNKTMLGFSIFKPGIDTPQKIHLEAEELAYIVSGSGKLTVKDELIEFNSGDSIHIPAGVPHGIRNDGSEDMAMVFFFSSPNYPKTKNA